MGTVFSCMGMEMEEEALRKKCTICLRVVAFAFCREDMLQGLQRMKDIDGLPK